MEEAAFPKYAVELTASARLAFFELVEYLYANMSEERADIVSKELLAKTWSLEYLHERGSPEPQLRENGRGYRYILYERTARAQIKIIYYADQVKKIVYVTDFFPTEKNTAAIKS